MYNNNNIYKRVKRENKQNKLDDCVFVNSNNNHKHKITFQYAKYRELHSNYSF